SGNAAREIAVGRDNADSLSRFQRSTRRQRDGPRFLVFMSRPDDGNARQCLANILIRRSLFRPESGVLSQRQGVIDDRRALVLVRTELHHFANAGTKAAQQMREAILRMTMR